jgi:hypothetical protein
MEITWFLPSHRLAQALKAPGEEKHALSASGFQLNSPCSLLYTPTLTLTKLHLYPHVLPMESSLWDAKNLEFFQSQIPPPLPTGLVRIFWSYLIL